MTAPDTQVAENQETKPKASNSKYLIPVMVVVIMLAVAGLALALSNIPEAKPATETTATATPTNTDTPTTGKRAATVLWSFNGSDWSAMGTAPDCTDPYEISSPADLTTATNILYPGQVRGGEYKPHGGVRFDNATDNSVEVRLPDNAALWRASRYIESGEVQYMLDFVTSCGIAYRFDHLLTLSAKSMAAIEEIPAAQVNESRTTNLNPAIEFEQGEIIATEIGFASSSNVAFDFGMYDLRTTNAISKDSAWAASQANKREYGFYAVCWLDYLVDTDEQLAKALPGSGTEGKTSDYCN